MFASISRAVVDSMIGYEYSVEFEVFKMYSQAKALDTLGHAATRESGDFRTRHLLASQTLSRKNDSPVG